MSCVSCLIFPFKNYFIKTCIISCDRTLHNSCYRDMGPYQQPICILFCFSLFSSQRGSIYCCPLFLKRSVFFFFKALNISKVKSVDTSLESLLSLFSSQGILNLSAVDNRKPNPYCPSFLTQPVVVNRVRWPWEIQYFVTFWTLSAGEVGNIMTKKSICNTSLTHSKFVFHF